MLLQQINNLPDLPNAVGESVTQIISGTGAVEKEAAKEVFSCFHL